ncbi:MAG: PASTA domain-containing protein, partial [Calditrichaeota bacterium]|nr:PASTA domain-containing protein [Calditrichota bacterium]
KTLAQADRNRLIDKWARPLDKSKSALSRIINSGLNDEKHTILLSKNISEDNWFLIQKSGPIWAEEKNSRIYGKIANNVIGYVSTDGEGISGLEKQFETELKGKDGVQILQRDAKGNAFTYTDYYRQEPEDGKHVVLTINKFHQSILENELHKAMYLYHSKGANGVILDPKSGEVLAMASLPSFDSNDPGNSATNTKYNSSNRTVLDVFDPGSTFKIITAAAALEEGLVKDKELINCENGAYKIGPKLYTEFGNKKHHFLTVQQIIEKSSNIGVIKLAERLGPITFYRYIRDFGFGEYTNLGLDSEAKGILRHPDQWSKLSLPSISFGHEISVTAIQLAQAYAAIANGGYLVKPRFIKEKLNHDMRVAYESEREVIRQVISESTSKKLTEYLISVVEEGTATAGKSDLFQIAGKTGTAEVYDYEKKSWKTGANTAVFSGFFPADQPKYVMVVVINEPAYKHLNYDGWTAAPTFKRIAEKLMGTIRTDEQIEENYLSADSTKIFLPDLVGLHINEAKLFLDNTDIEISIKGTGDYVLQQSPKSGSYDKKFISTITLVANKENAMVMPDLRSLTIREAIQKLKRFKIDIAIRGNGLVIGQSKAVGEEVKDNDKIILTCKES